MSATFYLAIICNILLLNHYTLAAVPHSHKAQGHHEREADGAFSPRHEAHHGGEGHEGAFDHEAILGKKSNFTLVYLLNLQDVINVQVGKKF